MNGLSCVQLILLLASMLVAPTSSTAEEGGFPAKAPAYWYCAADDAISQPPRLDDSGGLYLALSDDGSGLQAWEYYSGLSFLPTYITWWGVSAEYNGSFYVPCTRDPSHFRIRFFSDDGGQPGTQVASQSLNVAPTNTGVTLGGFPLYWYRTMISLPVTQSAGWVCVEGRFDPDCWFFWAPSATGDGTSLKFDGVDYETINTDLAFCIEQDEAPCPAGSEVSQLPLGPLEDFAAAPSDQALETLSTDTFSGVVDPIVGLRVWSLGYDAAFGACAPAEREMAVIFSPLGDLPGTGSYLHTETVVPLDMSMSYGPYALYQWHLPLTVPVLLESGQLAVAGSGSSDCAFVWMGSGQGDGSSRQRVMVDLGGILTERWIILDFDLSWCLVTDPDGCVRPVHSADQDADHLISLSELLRVIQFFNSGGYHGMPPPAESEDGYAPGPAEVNIVCPHCCDYDPPDWNIDIGELLRLIQFFNSGGYHHCPTADPPTEDGYCPGPDPA